MLSDAGSIDFRRWEQCFCSLKAMLLRAKNNAPTLWNDCSCHAEAMLLENQWKETEIFSLRNQLHGRVQSAGDGCPLVVGGALIVQVDDIDFVELSPLIAFSVEVGDAVGR